MPRFRYLGHGSPHLLLWAALPGLVFAVGGLNGCDDPEVVRSGGGEAPRPPAATTADDDLQGDPRFQLGRQLLANGRYAESEAVLTGVARARPDADVVDFLLAISIQKQKRYAPALEMLDELRGRGTDFPNREALEHFRGWCLFYLGRPAEAAEAFRAHLALTPSEPDSHFGLGVSLMELAETEEALVEFDRAIELDLGRPDRRRALGKAWIRRGDALWELDRPEEATKSYHKGVIQFADHYEGWSKLARGHQRLGRPEKVEWARREELNARRRVGAPIDGELTGTSDVGESNE